MTITNGSVAGAPNAILRLEGLFVFALATTLAFQMGIGWKLYAALLLAPDIFMLGYLINNRVGATLYNLAHTYVLPLALVALGYFLKINELVPIALVWIAHIGADRCIGYGLKYASHFKATHLSQA